MNPKYVRSCIFFLFLSACGGGGGGGSISSGGNTSTSPGANVTPPVADLTAPALGFSPNSLTVSSEATAASTLTATDNVAITTGPDVTCTNAGSFSGSVFTAPAVTVQTTSVCTATAMDAAGNSGSATLTVTIDPVTPPPADVTISGKVTFDNVPHNTATSGLNYAGTTQDPARGITVELLDSSDAVLGTTTTDSLGEYNFTVSANTDVRIRARAELLSTSGALWDVKTTDNTNNNSVYAIQGGLISSGSTDSSRNLNAASGWGGSSYTGTRSAAPFAILDPIYDTLQSFAAVDASINFPALQFRWSVLNRRESGDPATGQISTSSYLRLAGESVGNVYILGDENEDTDEYDPHVIIHEWGHYFEDQLSRSDSIGGQHTQTDRLDPRLAMGEGWGNALSGIILGDPVYRDSSGSMQGVGFSVDMDSNIALNPGWFSTASVQSILYDIADSGDDGADSVSLGLGPIYEVFTADDYKNLSYFTTIFGFINELKSQQAGSATQIDSLVAAQSINGTGPDGAGETNSGGVPHVLPIYNEASVNGSAVSICSSDDNQTVNKLGNREYLRVNIPSLKNYTFTMTRTSGAASTDPDFNILQGKFIFGSADSFTNNVETFPVTLNPGIYLIDAFDASNVGLGATPNDSCFDFTITD